MFMSMIKEADFLRNGNTKKVMNLSKRDHTQLWQSIASGQCFMPNFMCVYIYNTLIDNYNDFWSVNKQLVEYTPSNRHIPIRLYLSPDCPVIQELVSFHDEADKEKVRTIGDIVIEIIPELSERNIHVVTHGIPLPSETPINWAYVNLCFPDNFLHLIS
ncbi:hypothetical protein RMATCC62417_17485 [Rhizopus microsporus]|nr:hypothetical protein RMATCC62417_17485 [Rhizopus microsporus]